MYIYIKLDLKNLYKKNRVFTVEDKVHETIF
jgi:hypothetical protein